MFPIGCATGFSIDLKGFYISFYGWLQDSYAIQSFERGIAAQNSGLFAWEIVSVWYLFHRTEVPGLSDVILISVLHLQVEVSGGRGKPSTIVDKDEGLGKVIALVWRC